MRQLPNSRRPNHDNMRKRPNKARGINVPRDYSRFTSLNGKRRLSRTSSGRSANSVGTRSGRAQSRGTPRHQSPRQHGGGRSSSPRGKAYGVTPSYPSNSSRQPRAASLHSKSRSSSRTVSSTGMKTISGASRSRSGSLSSNLSENGTRQLCRKWMSSGGTREDKDKKKCPYKH